ncbi:putative serine/threonine-protein kinase/receptor [Termitomyces sp. T112]|nr:putative serine/threonine-protein kinase/receptor [Termitomyces sp. T112]
MPSQTLIECLDHPPVSESLERDNPQSRSDVLYAFYELPRQQSVGHQPDGLIQRLRLYRLPLQAALATSLIPSYMLRGRDFNIDVLDKGAPMIGSGGSANVFLYRTGRGAVAVKKFLYSKSHARKTFIKEAMFISSLRHQNVISFLGAIDNVTGFAIITPYLRNGDLPNFLRKNPSANRLKMAEGIACGLSHLKLCGVIHSDIKGTNILVNDDHVPVISDFGLAEYEGYEIGFDGRDEFTDTRYGSDAGTYRYMAPERLCPEAGKSARPTFSSDVFSFGMVLYEIYTGRIPYSESTDYQAMVLIVKGSHPVWDAQIPDQIWSLALGCWTDKPSDRLTVDEVVDYLSAFMQRKM